MKKVKSKLDAALAAIEKAFGKGAVMRMGDQSCVTDAGVISTGSNRLDSALGIGGLPKGRVVEVFGPESSGKTTLTLSAVAQLQRDGGVAAFVDAEHALDVSYAKQLGVDVESMLVSQPDTGEQALAIVDMLVRSEAVDIVVVDSVAALVPKAEIDGEIGDSHVGLQARLMSQALRKLAASAHRTGCTIVFTNQLRSKIGVTFGSSETTPGGKALRFYSSVRLDVRRIGTVKEEGEAVGNRTRVRVVKNKVAPPFRTAEFEITYGRGVNVPVELLEMALETGEVSKAGSWYSLGQQRLGQGRERAAAALLELGPAALELEKRVRGGCSGATPLGVWQARPTLADEANSREPADAMALAPAA